MKFRIHAHEIVMDTAVRIREHARGNARGVGPERQRNQVHHRLDTFAEIAHREGRIDLRQLRIRGGRLTVGPCPLDAFLHIAQGIKILLQHLLILRARLAQQRRGGVLHAVQHACQFRLAFGPCGIFENQIKRRLWIMLPAHRLVRFVVR